MSTVAELQAWIGAIVAGLVTAPAAIAIDEVFAVPTVLEIKVAEGDVGRIVGRDGRTIDALRQLVKIYAAGHDLCSVVLEVPQARSRGR